MKMGKNGFVIQDYPGITREVSNAFADSLRLHLENVREAAKIVSVSETLIDIHDLSKWSDEEFPFYARNFFGDGQNKTGFGIAWLHHIHNNPHHWQHWLFPDGYSIAGSDIIDGMAPMPTMYIREMVADWMASSKTYTKSWDMSEWLYRNMRKIIIHPKTADYLWSVLAGLGYSEEVYVWKKIHGREDQNG